MHAIEVSKAAASGGPLLLLCPALSVGQTIPEVRVEAARPEAPAALHPVERYGADFIAQSDGFTADEVLASCWTRTHPSRIRSRDTAAAHRSGEPTK